MSTNTPAINNLHGSVKPTRTKSKVHTPPVVIAEMIAKRTLGHSKKKIAKDLGLARNTVHKYLSQSRIEQDYSHIRREIVPVAYESVKNQILRGDGDLAMRYLENTDLSEHKAKSFADNRIQMAVQLIGSGTEAAAKAPPVSKSDQVGIQNLPILDCKPLKTGQLAENSAQLSFSFMEDP